MKKTAYITFLLTALLLFCTSVATAQDPEPTVTEKIERGAEELFNGIFGTGSKESEEEEESAESNVRVTVEEDDSSDEVAPSEFIGYFTLESLVTKNGRPNRDGPAIITYYIDEYSFAVTPKTDEGETTMIYDRREREVTTKTVNKDGDRAATITPMLRIRVNVEDRSVAEGAYTIEETGRTKTIEGYSCTEYRVETEDATTLAWATDAIPLDWRNIASFVQAKGPGGASHPTNIYGVDGVVLEAHMTSKRKDEVTDYYLKEIHEGSIPEEVFSLDGYQVNDLGSIFGN